MGLSSPGRREGVFCQRTSVFCEVEGHVMYGRKGVEIEEKSEWTSSRVDQT